MGTSADTAHDPSGDAATRHGLDEATVVVMDPSPRDSRRGAPTIPRGATIGRYVVLDEVGSGGMGRVLRAYDPKLQREVALKDVGARRLLAAASQRLVAEARAMAKLSHANVVTVYDVEELAGASTLGPFVLVMEYVAGRTLQAWLMEHPRTWREVVSHFVDAGRGLAAAHAVGLLHRDFKPSNVLVGDDDVVKVTDFGLAKLDVASLSGGPEPEASKSFGGTALDDPTVPPTETGVVMGSPRYMAPEQHERAPLTVAADQYAYCVALWEALVGEAPFLARTFGELRRAKKSGPPAFPRAVVPGHIADAVQRGLAPAPEDRWPSMQALLEALSDDPAKRRRRWLAIAAGAGAIAIAGVSWYASAGADARACTGAEAELVGVWDDDKRAAVEASMLGTGVPYAAHAWTWTAPALDDYVAQWQAVHTDACEAAAIRKEQSVAMMDLRMACLHRAKLELQAVTAAFAQADAKIVEQAQAAVGGLPPLSRCSDLEALQAEVEPPLPEQVDAVEAARVRIAEAKVAEAAGRYADAERTLDAAEAELDGVDYAPVHIELAVIRGDVMTSIGDIDGAEAILRDALERAFALHEWNSSFRAATLLMYLVGHRQQRPAEAMRYREFASALARGDPFRRAAYHKAVSLILIEQGEFAAAEDEARRALALWEESRGPEDLQVAVARGHIAGALSNQGKQAEAEVEYRRVLELRERVLGPEHPLVATSRANLALIIHHQGREAEAEAEQRRAFAVTLAVYGDDHAETGQSWANLALMIEAQGRDAEALEAYRRAAEILARALGPDHPHAMDAGTSLATTYLQQGDLESAEAEFRRVLPLLEARAGADDPKVAMMRGNLALVLEDLGHVDVAEVEWRRVLAAVEPGFGPESREVAIAWHNHAGVLHKLGRIAEAEARSRQAIAAWDASGAPKAEAAQGRARLAELLLEQHRVSEALAIAEEAWAAREAEMTAADQGRTAFVLARAVAASSSRPAARERSRELGEAARDAYARAGSEHADSAAEVARWLRARE